MLLAFRGVRVLLLAPLAALLADSSQVSKCAATMRYSKVRSGGGGFKLWWAAPLTWRAAGHAGAHADAGANVWAYLAWDSDSLGGDWRCHK